MSSLEERYIKQAKVFVENEKETKPEHIPLSREQES
jgi:hypothetical protein